MHKPCIHTNDNDPKTFQQEAVRRAKVEMAVEDHNGLLKLEGGACCL